MGMLMHHTWLNQQEAPKDDEMIIEEPVQIEPEEETPVNEPEPEKKPGRRKVSK